LIIFIFYLENFDDAEQDIMLDGTTSQTLPEKKKKKNVLN
jgi:hypothetical protein